MPSYVHQVTGYTLGSWMTAVVWKSLCQYPSTPLHVIGIPFLAPWNPPLTVLIINPACSGSFITANRQDWGIPNEPESSPIFRVGDGFENQTHSVQSIFLAPILLQFQSHWKKLVTQAKFKKKIGFQDNPLCFSVYLGTCPGTIVMLPLKNHA